MEISKEKLETALTEIQKDKSRVKRIIDAAGSREKAVSYISLLCLAFGMKVPNEVVSILREIR